jgi:CheY-specific phosphatase CheX
MAAIFEVMEQMFFVFSEPLREENGVYQMRSGIGFSGPVNGDLQFAVSGGLARIMAMNMLNIQNDEPSDTVIADCVKESANMICGNFLRKVDPEHVFQLTIPTLETLTVRSNDKATIDKDAIRLAFTAEGGGFQVLLRAPEHFLNGYERQ